MVESCHNPARPMERGLTIDGDFRELILSLVENGQLVSGGEKVIEDALTFQDPRARIVVSDLLKKRGVSTDELAAERWLKRDARQCEW